MVNPKEAANLVKLAINRFKSKADYFEFQEFQAKMVYENLNKFLSVPHDGFVIDFGCGSGGYTNYLGKKYSKVIGIDYYVKPLVVNDNIKYESHDLLAYKSKEKADLIFCSSVIEHIKYQQAFIKILNENIKEGGFLYLSFPPFYSLVGGHNLKPFHYLPEKIAIRLGKLLGLISKDVTSYENLISNLDDEKIRWGLYKTNVNAVKKMLRDNGFIIIHIKDRYLPLNFSSIPLIGDFLSLHTEFYCRKKNS